ncbi:MAG: DUF779 domain-containing protein [Pseudomonadota bacterium]
MSAKSSLERVVATPAALAFLDEIRAEYGAVMFHQSGGCCDGSSPMCFPQDEYLVGEGDVLLGFIAGAPVYIHDSQFRLWAHTQLVIDVVEGVGGMFSLDSGKGRRFFTRSRVLTAEELALGSVS